METVNGYFAGGMGGLVREWGDECSDNGGDGKNVCPNVFQPSVENSNRTSCIDESLELFQYFITLTGNAGPLIRWWFAPRSTL